MIGPRELQVFLAAAEQENFSFAARKLHMSQPSVSFQIQSLEQQLKVQLFQRIGHRIQLTQAGRDLLPLANEMMNLSCQIEEALEIMQSEIGGLLNIGCTTTPGRYILPPLIGAFRKLYPAVQCIVETTTDRANMEEKLLAKETQFAIFGLPPKNKRLVCWPIMVDDLVLIVPSNHRFADRSSVTPEELIGGEWVMREPTSATRQLIFSNFAERQIDPESLKVVMELGCPEAVVVAVENGCGISIVSRVAVCRSMLLGSLKIIPIEGMSMRREILLARNPSGTCTRVQDRFRDYLAADGQQVIKDLIDFS
jgi:DNA-binding transcriptional LysR family regulator